MGIDLVSWRGYFASAQGVILAGLSLFPTGIDQRCISTPFQCVLDSLYSARSPLYLHIKEWFDNISGIFAEAYNM